MIITGIDNREVVPFDGNKVCYVCGELTSGGTIVIVDEGVRLVALLRCHSCHPSVDEICDRFIGHNYMIQIT